MSCTIGIDPGLSGALSVVRGENGVSLDVKDMPTYTTHKGKSVRNHYDIKALRAFLKVWAVPGVTAYLERQQSMPGQSCVAVFSTGYGFGLIEGLLVALGLPYVVVSPQTWQKAMLAGTSGTTKERALTVARRLFPDADLGRRKDAGRADALLIAEWGRRQGRIVVSEIGRMDLSEAAVDLPAAGNCVTLSTGLGSVPAHVAKQGHLCSGCGVEHALGDPVYYDPSPSPHYLCGKCAYPLEKELP